MMTVSCMDNTTLRIKVTPICNLACVFCHTEGIMPTELLNEKQMDDILVFAQAHYFNRIHFTGGEPTLHPNLIGLIEMIRTRDMSSALTTNGTFQPHTLSCLKLAGIGNINFSLHTVNPVQWCLLQEGSSLLDATNNLEIILANIEHSIDIGIKTKINIVVNNPDAAMGVIEKTQHLNLELRLLDVLGDDKSRSSIEKVLEDLSATFIRKITVCGSSKSYLYYATGDRSIVVKLMQPKQLVSICTGCDRKCLEGFYGIRLEALDGEIYVRLCLQRNDFPAYMPLDDFVKSEQLIEILSVNRRRNR